MFSESGFVSDLSSKQWYFKEDHSQNIVEGPMSSDEMNSLLEKKKITSDTRVAFSDPLAKFISVKKLIAHTYGDKFEKIVNASKGEEEASITRAQPTSSRADDFARRNENKFNRNDNQSTIEGSHKSEE